MEIIEIERVQRIETLVRTAVWDEDPRGTIDEALKEMGEAVIAGECLDAGRLQRLAVEFAEAMRPYPDRLEKVLAGLRLTDNVRSFSRERRVQLGDGRTATSSGWSSKDVNWRVRQW